MPNSPNVRQTLQIGQRLTLRHQLGLTQIIQTARLLSCASEELRDEMEEACRKNPILELDYGPPKAGAETPTSDDSGMAESEDPGLDHSNNSGGEEKGAGAEADEMSARRDHDNTQASSEGSFENYDRDSDYERGYTPSNFLFPIDMQAIFNFLMPFFLPNAHIFYLSHYYLDLEIAITLNVSSKC